MRTDREGATMRYGRHPRRRVLGILAAASGLPMPGRVAATPRAEAPPLVTWRGPVLGGVGSIALHHPDRAAAERLIARALAEIRRAEALFSLWRADSLLSELNRRGILVAPPADMPRLLAAAQRVSALTGGVFDVTVQPLWRLYRDHFATPGADPEGPPRAALDAALERVGHRDLLVAPDRVALAQRGMAVTLNGIAQGHVTDRVVEALRAGGAERTLVDLGEARALGTHPAGRPWRAALEDPAAPDRPWGRLDLTDRALASSGDDGFVFDAAGRFTHLLDPRSGRSPRLHRAVAVTAPEATLADALSTAFALMPESAIAAALGALPGVEAHLLRPDGTTARLRGGPARDGATG
jgi:FAD:protein FMN transferase